MTSTDAVIRERIREELRLLQTQEEASQKLEPQAAFRFGTRLFEIFGGRFSKVIRERLTHQKPVFNQVHRAFLEIQKWLEQGITRYVELKWPQTAKLIKQYRYEGQNDELVFKELKAMSYGIHPFPQSILMEHQNPELGTLEKIEKVRRRAFYQVLDRLNVEEGLEEKGVDPLRPPEPLLPEEELEMTKLFFGGGAIVYGKKVIYFSEMAEIWGSLNEANRQRLEKVLSELTTRGWAKSDTEQIKAFVNRCDPNISFGRFLILCAIDAVKRNLKINVSLSVEKVLEERLGPEEIRSDLCCFTAELPRFYQLDVGQFKRFSVPLIRSFQLFLFLTRNFALRVEVRNTLLMILLHRDPHWNEKSLPSFCQRRWKNSPLGGDEINTFPIAWDGLQKILSGVAKRDVSFSIPTPEDETLFKTQDCWDLLFFLWKHPHRESFIHAISEFSKLRNFSMTVKTVLAFCRENEEIGSNEQMEDFLKSYESVVKELQGQNSEVQASQDIFFDPPLKIGSDMVTKLGAAAEGTSRFVGHMNAYAAFPKGKEFCLMLRQYIVHPNRVMFSLLRDVGHIGAQPSNALLWEALSRSHEPFDPEPVPTDETRKRARELTARIQEIYRFTDTQIFLIYLEMIRLIIRKEEEVVGKMSTLVHQLVSFCPGVQKKDVFFLFHYHPEIDGDPVSALAEKRERWTKDTAQLNRFVISQKFLSEIEDDIEGFVLSLSRACGDVRIANKFDQTLQYSLLSAFFPPLQPLTDYFRITDITADGPRWAEPSWQTHLGQLKFVLGGAKIGIYLNWSIQSDRPVLFISFFDMEKREAFSAFIPLDISATEIGDDRRRKVFFGLLLTLAPQVLKERADSDVPEEAPEEPDSWISAFDVKKTIDDYADAFKEQILKPEYMGKIWNFLKKVKLAYRELSLSRRPPLPHEPRAAASQGHIFPSHPRGSLLPKPLLEIEPHSEWYIPDGSESFMDVYQGRFTHSTAKPELLGLDLNMSDGRHPISHRVETADQVTKLVEERTHQNEVAPPLEQVQGMFVTLSAHGVSAPLRYPPEALENRDLFQEYFDAHNLFLKSAAYVTRADAMASESTETKSVDSF